MMRRLGLALVLSAACTDALVAPPPDPPLTPTLAEVPERTGSSFIVVRGSKEPNTALVVDDEEVIARSPASGFRLPFALEPGANTFVLRAVDAAGRSSKEAIVEVFFDETLPPSPSFAFSARTARTEAVLRGSKVDKTRLFENGVGVDEVAAADTTFTLVRALELRGNGFRFAVSDAEGRESAVVFVDVERFSIAGIPFSLCEAATDETCEPVASEAAGPTVTLSGRCDDDIEVSVAGRAPARCQGGAIALGEFAVPVDTTVRVGFVGESVDTGRDIAVQIAAAAVGEGEGEVVVGEGEGEGEVVVGEGEGEVVVVGEGEGEVVVVGEGEGE